MTKNKKAIINVQGSAINILSKNDEDFISLTDMAKKFGGDDLLYNWMRNRNTVEFLGAGGFPPLGALEIGRAHV